MFADRTQPPFFKAAKKGLELLPESFYNINVLGIRRMLTKKNPNEIIHYGNRGMHPMPGLKKIWKGLPGCTVVERTSHRKEYHEARH
jgi:hypothetical protein